MVHSSISKLKSLPDYYAAKRGDHHAASRTAHALVREAKTDVAIDYVVPVIQVDRGRYNAIPVAFGAVLAKHIGARLWLDVYQINKVDHTEDGDQRRLQNQPVIDATSPTDKLQNNDNVTTYDVTK